MITGIHVIAYAPEAEPARTFLRNVLRMRCVDAGHGWLIFALPPAELGVHPVEPANVDPARAKANPKKKPAGTREDGGQPRCELYLVCDNIRRTVAELEQAGVEFTSPVAEREWGLLTTMKVPGAGEIGLYEPRHPTAIGLNVCADR